MKQLWLCLIVVALLAPVMPAQTSVGTVSGTVRDQSGAVVPNVVVVITNVDTSVASTTRTNEVGFYISPGLNPGAYRISVEYPGMQKYEGTFTLQTAQRLVIDPVLVAGSTSTSVAVTDITPLVTVDSAITRATLDNSRIVQLPINGRTLNALIAVLPGAEGHRSFGLLAQAQEWIVDGTVVRDRRWSMSLFSQTVGMGSVQEFTVDTGAVSAKHSRPSNVIVSTKGGTNEIHGTAYETLRNNAIGLARARTDFFDKAPQLIRNEFGFNVGGPVVLPKIYNGKNRTFWFVNYESRRQASASTISFNLPTEAMRRGDFSGLVDAQGRQINIYDPWTTTSAGERQQFQYGGRLNVIDPSRISPTAKYLFEITPMPTTGANPLVDVNYWGTTKSYSPTWTVTSRIDHRFTDVDNFFVRWHWNSNPSIGRNTNQASPQATNQVPGWKYVLDGEKVISTSWMHTFSPAFFNELTAAARYRVGGGYSGTTNTMDTDWYGKLGLPNPFAVRDWPMFTDLGLGNYALVAPGTDRANETYFVVDDNVTKIHGKHEFLFGGRWRKDLMNIHPNNAAASAFTTNTLATALLDPRSAAANPLATPQTGLGLANVFLGVMTYQTSLLRSWYYLRSTETALYFQDNWKLSPRLTLNLGLRWEYWPAYREKNNLLVGFDPSDHAMVLGTDLDTMYRMNASVPSVVERYKSLGLKFKGYQEAGLPQNLVYNRNRNFGPRLGFAYRAFDGPRSFVIRGGYSLSYFNLDQNSFISNFNNTTPLNATFNYLPNDATQSPDGRPNYGLRSVPTVVMGVNSANVIDLNQPRGITRGTASASYFAPRMPDLQAHSWNLTLEKELAHSTVARARYVGNRTTNMSQWFSYNQPTPDYIWFATTRRQKPTGEFANVALRPYDQQVLGTVQEYQNVGWANTQGASLEFERRYAKGFGFQLSYVLTNALTTNPTGTLAELNQFMPGSVPVDMTERNRFLNYRRDTGIPKHRVQYNWIADLPFGRDKLIGRNVNRVLDKFIGGWQLAGIGTLRSNYFSLPTGNWNLTGEPIKMYGYDYPIEDCRSGTCIPGYLWWNGYIPAHQINSKDANGRPNGYMGVPADYKPAVTPLIPWGTTALPANAPAGTNISQFWDTNNVWIPLNDGTVQRVTYNDGLHPWRNQFLPSIRQWNVDASLLKNIRFKESLNLRFGADFFNVFNHPNNPNTVGGDGFLNCRASGTSPRVLQLSLRLDW